jgi:DNA-binding SARP family transcriptional activator/tetratricopeptide (TPR) repeat protein
MQFSVLGLVRAWRDGAELDLGPPKQRALLALLLIQANQPVSQSEILDLLWGQDPPGTAVNVVHRHVGALRRLFEPELPTRGSSSWLVRSSGGYRLDVDPQAIDLFRFRALRDEAAALAAAGQPGAARDRLRQALELAHDVTGAGLPAEVRAHPVFVAVDGERLSAIKLAADYALAAEPGAAQLVLPWLRQAAGQYPLDEALAARLMLVLAVAGDQAQALEVYRSVRDTLADELGLDPGAELQAAHQRVLRTAETQPGKEPTTAEPAAEISAISVLNPVLRPAQLPADLAVFTGRRHELDLFRTLLPERPEQSGSRSAPVIATIGGMAGVGKTTLAVHWAHQVADRYPDGQLYVNLRGFHPSGVITSSAEAIRSFLDALGVPANRVPASLDAQSALFRSLLAERRMVVLLDNARDSEHVLPLLPAAPGSLTIVTSRHQLSDLVAGQGASAVTLDLMPPAEAMEFLSRRLGPDRIALESDAAAEIIELSGRLPLTLAIVSARATMNPGFSLESIAGELRRSHGSLDAFTGEGPRSDVRSVFSWSYRTLEPETARLFRLIALHPGPDCSLAAVAVLAGPWPPGELRARLGQLLRAHLIFETTPGRYGSHELLRTYAMELALQPDSAADAGQARARLLDHYLHSALAALAAWVPGRERITLPPPVAGADPVRFDDGPAAIDWLDTERAVLIAAVEQDARHGSGRPAWQLATILEPYLDRIGIWPVQLSLQTVATAAAERLGDQHAQALTHRSLGFTHVRLGRLAEANRHLNLALDLFGATGDPGGQARTHRSLAFLANQLWRHQVALEHYRQAGELYRATGSLTGQANVHNEVGWTYILLGDYRRALDECRQAIAGHHGLGDRSGEAAAWDSLGYAQHHLQDYEPALVSFGHALTLYREVADRYLEADTLVHIGDTAHANGHSDAAGGAWRQALAILLELGHSDADVVRDKVRSLSPDRTSETRHSFG